MCRLALAALTLAAAAVVSLPANAAVTVIGSGMAKACSKAALGGAVDRDSEALCTLALEGELLTPRDRAGTLVNRGILKLRRREFDAANMDFNRAVAMMPDMGEAYVNRGAAAVGQHRFKEGLSDLNKSLELGVDEPEKAYYNRAIAYEGLDDLKAAYFDYQKALELKPGWEMPQRELARFTVHRP